MPLYRYRCEACGQDLEILQRSGAPAPERCGDDCALGGGGRVGVGRLVRQLSLTGGYNMGGASSSGGWSCPPPSEGCGRCGRAPES